MPADTLTASSEVPALARRPDVVIAPQDTGGAVAKDPATNCYYRLGPEELFLLERLDGRRTVHELKADYQKRFGRPLTLDDVREFIELARSQGLLAPAGSAPAAIAPPADKPAVPPPAPKQSLLNWRKSLFDPDALFNVIEPLLRWAWTKPFVVVSLVAIVAAGAVAWTGREELAAGAGGAFGIETAALVWLSLAAVTTLHEFAHGLTCKHFGGRVKEVGFLLMFFMPCFYCNVSDSWLLPNRRQRLAVTLAGPYSDLCVWAAAVFVWRFTQPDLVVNHLALVLIGVCGMRTVLNANPLIKLDGYYLLSDLLAIPNLKEEANAQLKGRLRQLLWGAEPPPPQPRAGVLLWYGVLSWLLPLFTLTLLFLTLGRTLAAALGPVGAGVALAFGTYVLSGQFAGIGGGEIGKMVQTRRGRTVGWAVALVGLALTLCLVRMDDKAGGQFRVRAAGRTEARAEVAGFVREVTVDEGDAVEAGRVVARIEVPHLDARLAQAKADRREAEARLKLLEIGPRPEEMTAQKEKVGRAEGWRDRAEAELTKAKAVLTADLARLDGETNQAVVEQRFAATALTRGESLRGRGIGTQELENMARRKELADTQVRQAEERRKARAETGTLAAEGELARREKELADARSALTLLEAGSRPEEKEAERARLDRLAEEITRLGDQQRRQAVVARGGGVVSTRRLRESVGKYVREGEVVCVLEGGDGLEAEIELDEQQTARVQPGQPVELKVQVLPLETLGGKVDRIAPRAGEDDHPDSKPHHAVTVYCRLDRVPAELRPGMGGYARVGGGGNRPVAAVLLDRGLKALKPEYWWW